MTLHSNYSHLLNSNEALDAATLVTLSKSRDAVRAEIRRLQEEEQVYTALLAPQRRLPAEILGEIFLLAIPGILDKSGREAVVKLCLVSKNWHNAALCTYRLWNRVSISPAVPLESYPKIVDWFSRSGDAPKALEYDTWSHSCIRFCSATNPLLRKLLLGGPLLKHLKLKLVQIRCFRTFLFSIALKADATWKRHVWDSLASFHLNFMDYPQLPPGVTLIVDDVHATHGHWIETRESTESLFQHIPFKANIFHLDLPAIDSAFLNPEFSRHAKLHIPPDILGCFTTFSIRCDWDGDHLVNMLKHCTHVQTLNLDFNSRGIYTKRERERAPGAVTLPRVRQLRFRNAANIMFLLGIKTPALQELDLGWSGDPATGDLFCQFLRKYLVESGNAGNLRSLRIANLRLSTTDLSPLFAPLRHLETSQASGQDCKDLTSGLLGEIYGTQPGIRHCLRG
ncbi:hypothetical protein NMY22_g13400 [Coprinellus aureogranulatus]|nr:hypothetical protein NMY22_g13400 [Coprinellus aureogranulatus]